MKGLKKVFLLLGIILTVIFQINSINVSCEESQVGEDSNYKLLPISVKQFNNDTVLDNDGKVWLLADEGRATGYQWMDPIDIPGMVNGVLIGDRISLLSNGTIWSWDTIDSPASWDYQTRLNPHSAIIEHQLGVLPEDLAVSDVVKIFKYDDYIFMIDNKGVLYYVYNYDKKVETGCTNLKMTQLLQNVKDIGYGYILDNNGKVHWFHITTKNNKVTINLNYIMDNIKQLVSGKDYSLCLDNDGKVFGLNDVDSQMNKELYSSPVNITGIPLMSKLFDTCQSPYFASIGEDIDGNLMGINFGYPITPEGVVEHKKMVINDYSDIIGLYKHIIVIKNDNTAKSWLMDDQIYWDMWGSESESVSPEK